MTSKKRRSLKKGRRDLNNKKTTDEGKKGKIHYR